MARFLVITVLGLLLPLLRLAPALAVDVPGEVRGAATQTGVYWIPLKGPLTQGMADFLHEGLQQAVTNHAEAVVVELDIPGGKDTAARVALQGLLSSTLPVIAVIPPRGRVSSTGVYLLLGADAVALGPESRIGPSHPIRLAPGPGGGLDLRSILSPVGGSTVVSGQTSPMAESLAFAERLGQQRGNGGIADAVRSAIEGRTLLGRDLQGRAGVQIVETAGFRPVGVVRGFDQTSIGRASPPRVLSLATPAIVALAPAWYVQIGQVVANPWVVLFFLLLGIYGLVSELLHPGTVLPALLGVTALGLAGWGLWSLPVAPWGVVLVIFGALFILAEAKVGGPGFFGIPGAIMFLWGALTFIPAQYGDLRIPVYAVGLIGVLVLGLGFMAIRYIRHALQSGPAIGGIEGLVGEVGEARSPLAPEGTIFVHGEYWSARTRDLAPLPEGAAVRVLAKEGPLLVVEPVPPPP